MREKKKKTRLEPFLSFFEPEKKTAKKTWEEDLNKKLWSLKIVLEWRQLNKFKLFDPSSFMVTFISTLTSDLSA